VHAERLKFGMVSKKKDLPTWEKVGIMVVGTLTIVGLLVFVLFLMGKFGKHVTKVASDPQTMKNFETLLPLLAL
jgi:hypothetical protein